jgi:predicted Zn-dependent peptidase
MPAIHGTDLENGLSFTELEVDGTRSTTLLVAFDAGARTERPEENGMAHFLEHLVFRGGERYATHRDITHTAEALGAQIGAYTTHDLVAFHVTCRAEAVMEAADLLTDFVARARLDPDELERERGVVIQEIAQSDDQPGRRASKLLDRAVYGDHPLGRPILGPAEHLRSFSREAILAFRERRWAPGRGGAFIAGNLSGVDRARLAELLGRFPARDELDPPEPAPPFERRVLVEEQDTNQSHLRLHWQAPIEPADTRRRATLAVYSTLLGGSMGSRLSDEIRERRGLCYSIWSRPRAHFDAARLTVGAGLESTKCVEAYGRVSAIVDELATNGPRAGEVERARAYAAGSMVLRLERSSAVAFRAAGRKIIHDQVTSPQKEIAALDGVTEDDVREVARGLRGKPVVACVGPHVSQEFE